ncbi:hypothetical protein WN944_012984 [Citrus x changshan-huyou]|uniref:Uncharacterized protein n=1 Tax=Citrus x changshan-huyou TaxID=2935761 RepID=A0AAP0M729_9ROSI
MYLRNSKRWGRVDFQQNAGVQKCPRKCNQWVSFLYTPKPRCLPQGPKFQTEGHRFMITSSNCCKVKEGRHTGDGQQRRRLAKVGYIKHLELKGASSIALPF